MCAHDGDWTQTVFDLAHEAMAVLTLDGRVVHANRRWVELMQVPVGQVLARQIRGNADDLPTGNGADATQAREHRVPPIPITHEDGRRLYVECSFSRLTIAGEVVDLATAHDVTHTVTARHALAASERHYRALIEHLPDVVWSASLDGQLTFISPNVERVCGFTAAELLAAPAAFWFDRTHPEDAAALHEAHHSTAPDGAEVEYRWLAKDGQWRWLRTRASLAVAESGDVFTHGTFADVTAQKRLEAHVRQAQKMEALGQLTGGIAHDFNNLLTVVIGSGELLRTSMEATDSRRDEVDAILEAGQRGAALTRQLVAFSRREIREPRTLNLNQIVTDLTPMLRRVIGEDITLTLRLQPDLATVWADAGQMEQVLMHLAVNARDAMPRGGRLTIESATVTLAGEDTVSDGTISGEFVMLAVSDTGCGMDEDTRRRAFEPFFTTKDTGIGTGLGLATCYGIVKQSDGHILVQSAPGAGTTFRVYLPRPVHANDDLPALGDTTHSGRLTGSETVLLVEDDEHVRSTVERVLTSFGYRVIAATDGDDAQAFAVTHDGPVHLILSDVVMPGAAGPEVVERLREVLDDPRVLFMSGYTDHALLRSAVTETRVHFLQKPFLPVTLLERVREVLDV